MLAFALRADGWYLRSDIIWAKKNCMPESVTDRPTTAHEYVFLLSKSQKYFYDSEAIKEPCISDHDSGNGFAGRQGGSRDLPMSGGKGTVEQWRRKRKVNGPNSRMLIERTPAGQTNKPNPSRSNVRRDPASPRLHGNLPGRDDGGAACNQPGQENRNKRSVWTVATAPYADAHFATYPPDLIKPMILAGCPVGGTILDPFAGSFTTGMVALELGRSCIGIELNPDYIELGKSRCNVTPGLPL